MEIFIGNLPPTTTVHDLYRLFGPFQRRVLARVFRKNDRRGATICYALALLSPDSAARRALARLQGAKLQCRPLVVREFMPRSCANERRALDWRSRPWPGPERRRSERRVS